MIERDFDDICSRVVRERLQGKSFSRIARDNLLPSTTYAQHLFIWKTAIEPLQWRQESNDTELRRFDALLETYYPQALAGNAKAARLVLDISNLRLKYLQDVQLLPNKSMEELEKAMETFFSDLKSQEEELRKPIEDMNNLLHKVESDVARESNPS
jgi:hypothetical protein